jgi:hypothetical protein
MTGNLIDNDLIDKYSFANNNNNNTKITKSQ